MLGSDPETTARVACVEGLKPFVTRHRSVIPWPRQFWLDAYVIGFIVGLTTVMTRLSSNKLTKIEASRAVLGALEDVGCDISSFNECAMYLIGEKNSDYRLGLENAGTVVSYVMKLRPLNDHPDVIAAMQVLREVAPEKKVEYRDVGGALMYMLFHAIVERRLNIGEQH
jgi:hypothetical protein